MKKIAILLAIASLTFTSCEDFLDKQLEGQFTSENIYNTPEDANSALIGVYNSLRFTTSDNMIWVFGDVASDDAVKGGSDGDQADIGLIDQFNVLPTNGVINTYWKFAYQGIASANNVIAGVSKADFDNDVKQQIVAEAKFIRAYYYFNLVNIWGQVPLRLLPTQPNTVNVPLSSVAGVYAQIEADLNDAKAVLPVSYSSADAGRATKGAALGLLAKAQLYQEKWADCLLTIKALDDLHIYGLEDNYLDLFKLGAENSKEAIFAIRHLSNKNPGLGNSLNQWFAPAIEQGYYFNAPTASYVASFNETTLDGKTDPRLDASIGRDGQLWTDGSIFDPTWSVTGYLVRKHNQSTAEVPVGTKGDGGLAYIYLRYADILLMKAEAMVKTGAYITAPDPLNAVKRRVKLPDTTPATAEQMMLAIQLERRRELGFEFHRFFDLMRWGKTVAQDALGPNFEWKEPRYYFPIPQAERQANTAITQ